MKTADLIGAELDWWTAQAIGSAYTSYADEQRRVRLETDDLPLSSWSPSTDWAQGGPLMAEHIDTLERTRPDRWEAEHWDGPAGDAKIGSTPLIAACRAIVANKFGEEV